MEDDEGCITGLSLGLGIMGGNHHVPKKEMNKQKKVPCLDLSFELFCPKGEEEEEEQEKEKQEAIDQQQHDDYDKAKGSSLFCLKHPNETSPDDDDSNNNSNNNGSSRKKLKLTKEQSATLEDIFRLHSTLNPAQKQALAEQLNLKHRQVEVWFQNRRARTKLKQTEVDCEFLKKCCEKLTDENLRLKKELQELRAQQKIGPTPLYIQLSKATTLTICSSCEKLLKKPNEENNKGAINKLKNSRELGGI